MKAAACGQMRRIGHDVSQAHIRQAQARFGRQDAGQQSLRIGMARCLEQIGCLIALDHTPQIHHHHLARHMFHNSQIMADKHIGQFEVAAQLIQQIENLRLHRHIQRRCRLVANHNARFQNQRAGNGHTLALPA